LPVLVERLGCNGGKTGSILEPVVEYRASEIVVWFEVEPVEGPATCPGNKREAYDLALSEPVGIRSLVDGHCLPGEAAETTSHCRSGGVRWAP
jgi:hypothetical protein